MTEPASTPSPESKKPAKPWYLRWWAIVAGAVLVIGMVGNITNALGITSSEPTATATPHSTSTYSPAPYTPLPAPKPSESETASAEPTAEPTPRGAFAQAACDQAISQRVYPDKWNGSWVVGKLAERYENGSWFFKVMGKTKSAAGAKLSVEAECTVTGTDENPVVSSVSVY